MTREQKLQREAAQRRWLITPGGIARWEAERQRKRLKARKRAKNLQKQDQ